MELGPTATPVAGARYSVNSLQGDIHGVYVNLLFNGISVPCLVDSGANCCLMSTKVLNAVKDEATFIETVNSTVLQLQVTK